MQNIVILTGAGFTHNWGAPLAEDMWHLIHNNSVLAKYPLIKEMMKKKKYEFNYEHLYYEICQKVDCSDKMKIIRDNGGVDAYKKAVYSAYEFIDKILREHKTDPYVDYLSEFLHECCFKDKKIYMFTLNQDLFVERYLKPSIPGIPPAVKTLENLARKAFENKYFLELSANMADSILYIEGINYIKLHGK